MTPSELLGLAGIVEPGFSGERSWRLAGGAKVPNRWEFEDGKPEVKLIQFNPSLTGTAEQKAQALDVIVAAENSPECHQAYRNHVANGMSAFEASAKALIASRGKGENA